MIVSKFLHTRMRVNDLEHTLEFYQRVFGLEVTRRHESPRGSKLAFWLYLTATKKLKSHIFQVPVRSRYRKI